MNSVNSIVLSGLKASAGLSLGPAFFVKETTQAQKKSSVVSAENEKSIFNMAIKKSVSDLESLKAKLQASGNTESVEIIEAHLSLIEDPEVMDQTLAKISADKISANEAYLSVIAEFKQAFLNVEDDYIKQRILDLDDISQRVSFYINNPNGKFGTLDISTPSIVFAKDLTPSEILSLDKSQVLGIVLSQGSPQSHTAILARSMEIPCVVSTDHLTQVDTSKISNAILNANESKVILNPTLIDIETFNIRNQKEQDRLKQLAAFKGKPTKTSSGKLIPLGANISGPQDLASIHKNDAELVGLYRTEFLFLDRTSAPSEEEQYSIYKTVFQGLGSKRMVIRTLDIGGDKAISYLNMAAEENPFLGVRGIRLCLKYKDLFKTQLRAILRASEFAHDLGIMFPMISTLDEIRQAKALFDEVKSELKSENKKIGNKIDLGIMVEVPSIAWLLKEVSEEVTFISIGTNDLFQYSNACDRMNAELKSISDPTHEGFLRFLNFIIKEAKKNHLHVAVCGSIAHHPKIMPYLIECGVDDLSMTAQHILESREVISKLK